MKMLICAILVVSLSSVERRADAADNPVIRKMIAAKITSELASHDSQKAAWHSSAKKKQKKWAKTKVFGREIKTLIAEWTEETKTWVWLDKPKQTLSVDIRRFEIKKGVIHFEAVAKAKAKLKAWGKIPNVVSADVKGSARPEITIAGSVRVADGRLSGASISKVEGKLRDVRFSNDALRAVQGLVQDALNIYIHQNESKMKKQLEKSINGTKV